MKCFPKSSAFISHIHLGKAHRKHLERGGFLQKHARWTDKSSALFYMGQSDFFTTCGGSWFKFVGSRFKFKMLNTMHQILQNYVFIYAVTQQY